jgi:hypothetical protein
VILPQLAAFLFPSEIYLFWICSASVAFVLWGASFFSGANPMEMMPAKKHEGFLMADRKNFFEIYRAYTMLMVIISIFAVDFTVYPKRFMKTEVFGSESRSLECH